MPLVGLNGKCFTPPSRIYQRGAYEIGVRDAVGGGDCERIFKDCFYGTPDVYYLKTAFEEFWGFGRQVVRDAIATGGVGLIYVYFSDGTAELDAGGAFVWCLTTDCVVKDEDAVSSRAVLLWFRIIDLR